MDVLKHEKFLWVSSLYKEKWSCDCKIEIIKSLISDLYTPKWCIVFSTLVYLDLDHHKYVHKLCVIIGKGDLLCFHPIMCFHPLWVGGDRSCGIFTRFCSN